MATAPLDEDEVARLRLVVLRLARRLRKHSGTDVTPSQFSALSLLQRHGPLRLGELARREQVSKSTVTRLVANLEAKDLIQRTSDALDGRSAQVELTARGHQHLTEAAERSNAYLREQLRALSAADREAVLAAISAMEHVLAMKP